MGEHSCADARKVVEVLKNTFITVALRPTSLLQASGNFNIYVPPGLSPLADTCMGTQLCIKMLAESGQQWTLDEEFQLRNDNDLQRICLSSPAQMPSALLELCDA